MLKGITWGQFLDFLIVVTGGYYLYVFVAYYKAEVLGWLTRKGGKKADPAGDTSGDHSGGSPDETASTAMASEAARSVEAARNERADAGNDSGEQFRAMQRAIAVIRQVIAQGIENKLDRENLLDHIKEVLGSYRQLRKTEYAETINNFLIRVCSSELSLEIGEAELTDLWK